MVHKTCSLAKRNFKGLMRPMKLKSSVRASSKEKKTTPCVHEMTSIMTCWKANTFDDVPCRKEIAAFVSCVERVKKEQASNTSTSKDRSGNTRYDVDELNKRMRQFVWKE